MPMGMMGGPAFGMMPFEERYHALPVAAAEKSDTSKLEVRYGMSPNIVDATLPRSHLAQAGGKILLPPSGF